MQVMAARPDRLDELHERRRRAGELKPNQLRGLAWEARALAADASNLAIALEAAALEIETGGREPF